MFAKTLWVQFDISHFSSLLLLPVILVALSPVPSKTLSATALVQAQSNRSKVLSAFLLPGSSFFVSPVTVPLESDFYILTVILCCSKFSSVKSLLTEEKQEP